MPLYIFTEGIWFTACIPVLFNYELQQLVRQADDTPHAINIITTQTHIHRHTHFPHVLSEMLSTNRTNNNNGGRKKNNNNAQNKLLVYNHQTPAGRMLSRHSHAWNLKKKKQIREETSNNRVYQLTSTLPALVIQTASTTASPVLALSAICQIGCCWKHRRRAASFYREKNKS